MTTMIIGFAWPPLMLALAWYLYNRLSPDVPTVVAATCALTFAWVIAASWSLPWYAVDRVGDAGAAAAQLAHPLADPGDRHAVVAALQRWISDERAGRPDAVTAPAAPEDPAP